MLWTSGSCVPERWAKHGTAPVWASEAEEEGGWCGGVEGEGSGGRTLEGEVGRLLKGQASMAEAFEVRYRELGPTLRRKKAELEAAAAVGGAGGGGIRRGL